MIKQDFEKLMMCVGDTVAVSVAASKPLACLGSALGVSAMLCVCAIFILHRFVHIYTSIYIYIYIYFFICH